MANTRRIQAFFRALFAESPDSAIYPQNSTAKVVVRFPGKAINNRHAFGFLLSWIKSSVDHRQYNKDGTEKSINDMIQDTDTNYDFSTSIFTEFQIFKKIFGENKLSMSIVSDNNEKRLVDFCHMTFEELRTTYKNKKFYFVFEITEPSFEGVVGYITLNPKRVQDSEEKFARKFVREFFLCAEETEKTTEMESSSQSTTASSSHASSSTSSSKHSSKKKRKRSQREETRQSPSKSEIKKAKRVLDNLLVNNPEFLQEGIRVFNIADTVCDEVEGLGIIEGFLSYIPQKDLRSIVLHALHKNPKLKADNIVDALEDKAVDFFTKKIEELSQTQEYLDFLKASFDEK